MPLNPFTLVLAAVLVAGHAWFLFWPSPQSMTFGKYALTLEPLLLLLLVWSAGKSVSAFDDRAFHRTRPITDGAAHGKVMRLLLLMFGCIALVMAAYARYHHLGWQVGAYGAAVLVLPALGWTAACGLASSLSSSRQWQRIWPWLAVLATPAASASVLAVMRDGLEPESSWGFWLTPIHTTVLTAAILYPLIWWLVAARRRVMVGIALTLWLGALLPWIWIYGVFRPFEESLYDSPVPTLGKIRITRLPYDNRGEEKPIPVHDLLRVEGLERGWVGAITTVFVPDERAYLRVIPEDLDVDLSDWMNVLYREPDTGETEHGTDDHWWDVKQLAPESFPTSPWVGDEDENATACFIAPGASLQVTAPNGEARVLEAPVDYLEKTWRVRCTARRLEKLGKVDLSRGGRLPFPTGGILEVGPLVSTDEGEEYLKLAIVYGDLDKRIFPGLGAGRIPFEFELYAIIQDPESGERFRVKTTFGGSEDRDMFLAKRVPLRIELTGTPADQQRQRHLLTNGRMTVFWPRFIGIAPEHELAPPVGP